jgi:spore maturation protein SpmA
VVLNYIWVGFFLIALVVGLVRLIAFGDTEVFTAMVNSTFEMAKTGFEISLGLTGVLTLWLGLMKVGERGGAIGALAVVARPFFQRLFPGVPKDHPAHGSIIMNFAANMLGLDNAATPFGLKAMKELQTLNPTEDTATDAMATFLAINTSNVTLLPITIIALRVASGSEQPARPIAGMFLATLVSTIVAVIAVRYLARRPAYAFPAITEQQGTVPPNEKA